MRQRNKADTVKWSKRVTGQTIALILNAMRKLIMTNKKMGRPSVPYERKTMSIPVPLVEEFKARIAEYKKELGL